jgi:putative FmdB family regulatory protein
MSGPLLETLMPFYEYHCDACKADFDHMASMKARDQKVACPQCGSRKTARKLSAPAVGAAAGASRGGSGGNGGGGCCGGQCCCGGH